MAKQLTPEQEAHKKELIATYKNFSYNVLCEKLANAVMKISELEAENKDLKDKGSSEKVRNKRDAYNDERIFYRDAIKQTIKYLQGKIDAKKKQPTEEQPQEQQQA